MATKYLIFSVIFFGYAMFAYNRKGVSFAIPKLLEEGVGNEDLGLILSSQNLAYAISKFLGGIISDKLSSRVLFSSGLLISGLAAVLFSYMDSVLTFTLIWFMNGLAQGVGWPAIAKLLKNWFDPAELGTWWSLASASANLSGCIAPFVASYIIHSYGWRLSLIFVGTLTIFAAAVSFIFIVDSPKKKVPVSPSKKDNPVVKKRSSLGLLLSTKFIWVISISYLVASTIKTCVTDWSQLYLLEDCKQPSIIANSFVSSVEFGGFVGGIAAGYLSDLYMKYTLKDTKTLPAKGHPRMVVALGFALISCASLYGLYFHVDEDTSAIVINQLGILIGASIYGQIALFGVVATQSVSGDMSGTAHAIAALAANVGSIMAGLPFATIAKNYSWSFVFYLLLAIMIGMTAFMFLVRNTSYTVRDVKQAGEDKKTK